MSTDFDRAQFDTSTPESHCPCVLLLDTPPPRIRLPSDCDAPVTLFTVVALEPVNYRGGASAGVDIVDGSKQAR